MKGQLLGTLSHKDGEIRIVWDEYESYHFLTVRTRDLPILGEAIGKALDLALMESGTKGGRICSEPNRCIQSITRMDRSPVLTMEHRRMANK